MSSSKIKKSVIINIKGDKMNDLEIIKGVGPKGIKLLNELNLYTIKDLISFYPFRYNYIKATSLESDSVVVNAKVMTIPIGYRLRNNLNRMTFTADINNNLVNVVIYNRIFLKSHLVLNKGITIIGKYDKFKNIITASDIKLYQIGNSIKIEPVYHTVKGIGSKVLNNYINEALNIYSDEVIDDIPNYLNEKYKFVNKLTAINEIHNPTDINLLNKVIKKLKYEELFNFMLKINYLKKQKRNTSGIKRNIDKAKIDTFISLLPFSLTSDQLTSVNDILNDLSSNNKMNRLLQGDVGSGKTIVAFIGIYANYLSGYQGALMVPTEVLAIQHYKNAKNLFKGLLNVELLIGSTPKKKKEEIIKKLANNEIDFIIGTHTLIEESIKFNNLGFIITDEQHRFGVNQRALLKNKGISSDILYLSATPIPRTYALTIYGDLDISNIKTRPKDRKDIKTYLRSSKELDSVTELMLKELELDHQIFVIAPLIEESENSNLIDINKLYERLNNAFGKKYKVDILNGKMKPKAKQEIMEQFKNNEIKILISTTVVEVGVDIPNATMMIIFDAHQFGLATLHQLRGRVGRSDLESYCILISNYEKERLNIMTKTNDGFVISEEDFKLRGHGDLFGLKQSGDMVFKLADIKTDYKMLMAAKEDSEEYLNNHSNNDSLIIKNVKQLESLD